MSDQKTKRVIDIKPVAAPSAAEERRRQLESEIIMQVEQLPLLGDDDWGKIQFLLNHEGSLYRKAQAAKCRAILNLLGPARNTPAWTSQDDYLAYDLYLTTYREALDYLIRAESLLGHLQEPEYALFEDFDLDKTAQLAIYLAWLKRRFSLAEAGG